MLPGGDDGDRYRDALARVARLNAILELTQSISASLDTADVMHRIANAAAALAEDSVAVVREYDADRGVLRTVATAGGEAEGLPSELPVSAGLPGIVLEQWRPVTVDDPAVHPRAVAREWWQKHPDARYHGVPIAAADILLGVLDFIVPGRAPSHEETEALRLLAAHAGVAIRNARLYEQERRQGARVRALADVNRRISAALDLDELLQAIAESAARIGGVRFASFWVADDRARKLMLSRGSHPAMTADIPISTLDYDEGGVGWIAAHREPLLVDDVASDERIIHKDWWARWELRGFAGYPVMAGEELLAVLLLSDREPLRPDAVANDTIELFVAQAAVAIQNARLYASAQANLARVRETQMQLVQAAKLSAVGQLVSGVAHELNNPLSVVIGYGQLLLNRDVPPALRRPIELMVSQGDRMARIVRNLLLFARQRPPERVAVQLNEVIDDALALRLNQLMVSSIIVERRFGRDLPDIAGDAQQLQQVFLNLVLNAEQAIVAAGRPGRIVVVTERSAAGDTVRASLTDDGPGISPETLPRIFEPFFTTKEVGSGTGLGLSVSYGIVQEHGGRLSAASRPGETTFVVELPVVTAMPAATDVPPAGPVHGDGRAALVVDDEASVVGLALTILEETGWSVDVAASGREALERLASRRYELVVSDIRMADGDGPALYRQAALRQPAIARRFLFITGDTANPEVWRFLRETAVPFIEKPFTPAAFLDAVRRATVTLAPSPA
jgi:two-component system NtrC family sensor kinase